MGSTLSLRLVPTLRPDAGPTRRHEASARPERAAPARGPRHGGVGLGAGV